MSDIVERLREVAERPDANYPAVMEQAADEITRLRAENERLNKSRNKWGQKYNKLLEKHNVTLSQLKTAVWSDSEECKLLNAENERLREVEAEFWSQNDALGKALLDNKQLKAALADVHAAAGNNHLIANIARAALEERT